MNRRFLALILAFPMVFSRLVACSAEVLLREDYSQPRRLTAMGVKCWRFERGALHFRASRGRSRLITNIEESDNIRITATVTLDSRDGGAWASAGLLLHKNPGNEWRLLLVESPHGQRYLELIEEYNGVHQAQSQMGTKLPSKLTGELRTWEYGRTYQLMLAITPEAVTGEVRDPQSGKFWRKTYPFVSNKAVKMGRAGLYVFEMNGRFGELVVEGTLPAARVQLDVERGTAGGIVVVSDGEGTLAEKIAEMMRDAGFGVRVVSWEELDGARFSRKSVDLVILADARTMPHFSKRAILTFLRAGGKLIAVGAPAFGKIVAKTPSGWVGMERYAQAILPTLETQPVGFADAEWRYYAMIPELPHSYEQVAEGSYRFNLEFKGWGGFKKRLDKPAPEGFDALVFEAKGDAETPQLSIECVESDLSRWIATIELKTFWKTYLLRPEDFPFWHDSPAKRGGAGDRLNMQNAIELKFGVSGSHTPRNRAGRHSFSVRNIRWAKPSNERAPDFSLPEIEILSPSYKLYPLWETASLRAAADEFVLSADWKADWRGKGYSPVWREGGRGFDRQRAWRWVPIVEALDEKGCVRGALVSLMLGDHVNYGAAWANFGVADPAEAVKPPLAGVLTALTKRMVEGCFLLEGGSRFFSYYDGEEIELGATAVNRGRKGRSVSIRFRVQDSDGAELFERAFPIEMSAGDIETVGCSYKPERLPEDGLSVEVSLLRGGEVIDRITHAIDRLPSEPAKPDEFVRVEGSNFYLGKEKWFMLGVNYYPTLIGGYPSLNVYQRSNYAPVIIERDLAAMEAMGINFLSAIHALVPPNPDDPLAYRDMVDFLNRCRKHGMKVFYFLPWGNPFLRADVEAIKRHLSISGIKDHPAVLAWELAWEPIYSFGGRKRLPDLRKEWTRWLEQRYGSIENAERDWDYKLEREEGLVAIPTPEMCRAHGKWDRAVAGFRRFYSDYVSQLYRDIVCELRAFDDKHLITFRGGACGIPSGVRFAHLHSVGVAKHIDFLCPEGYNLKTGGMGAPTPPDDIRKGGLVTLYYRFISREKPVVWMEFGYTVNGFRAVWHTNMVHIKPQKLLEQKAEYEAFYGMFLESGARGAAPWWLPGGFRLGENSDFGIFNCDGTERPCCEVMRKYMPMFSQVVHDEPTAYIEFDLDRHYPDAWEVYGEEYLKLVKAGERPYIKTAGTGTDSSNTPLIAVGGVPCNGHNPPIFLNAEFNSLSISTGKGVWREVRDGDVVEVERGAQLLCKASVGNIGEAKWLAPRDGLKQGGVYLAGRKEYGYEFKAPIAEDTEFLHDAEVKPFTLIQSVQSDTKLSFEMLAEGRVYFGERRRITIKVRD